MQHRVISRDGYHECFACGTVVVVVSVGDTTGTFDRVPCQPGGWAHPPYLMPYPQSLTDDGQDVTPFPLVETCAAHPYGSCEGEARATAHGDAFLAALRVVRP